MRAPSFNCFRLTLEEVSSRHKAFSDIWLQLSSILSSLLNCLCSPSRVIFSEVLKADILRTLKFSPHMFNNLSKPKSVTCFQRQSSIVKFSSLLSSLSVLIYASVMFMEHNLSLIKIWPHITRSPVNSSHIFKFPSPLQTILTALTWDTLKIDRRSTLDLAVSVHTCLSRASTLDFSNRLQSLKLFLA